MHPFVDKILAPFDQVLAVDSIWRLVEMSVIRFARGLRRRRTRVLIDCVKKQLELNPEVRQGRFSGMRYASVEATCSAVLPKLLGTYEAELDAVFEGVFLKNYDHIVDVGCAEGFYAIGLARIFVDNCVTAFDIDTHAQELCRENAALNGVADRVEIAGAVSGQDLATACRSRRCLVVCDCEGYESMLFTHETVDAFSYSDLIIETHDFLEPGLCKRLSALFALTHEVQILHSIDDPQKARIYQCDLVNHLDLEVREMAYAEGRPVIMEWLFLTPKKN